MSKVETERSDAARARWTEDGRAPEGDAERKFHQAVEFSPGNEADALAILHWAMDEEAGR